MTQDTRLARAIVVVRIVTGLLFLQHGGEKLFGFAGLRPETNLWGMRGVGGMIEIIGAPLVVFGLFTRPVAFILCGEMAVVYFRTWARRSFFPIANNGEEAVVFCYAFLWLWWAGAGQWGLNSVIAKARGRVSESWLGAWFSAWEPYTRSLVSLVVGFLFVLHGCRKLFGVLPATFGRRVVPPIALDGFLLPWTGYVELIGGALLMLGLFVRQTAMVLAVECLLAYLVVSQPRALWPIINRGNETLVYAAMLLCFSVVGGGALALDRLRRPRQAVSLKPAKSFS